MRTEINFASNFLEKSAQFNFLNLKVKVNSLKKRANLGWPKAAQDAKAH